MDAIDRVSPTLRPARPAIMLQRWADLLFLHWPVPVEALRPLVPPRLEIDTFEGRAYVAVVPFTIPRTRFSYLPPLPPTHFHEVNTRTYVHLDGRDPGVWFFSLDAASRLAVLGARAWFGLPYQHARMSLRRPAEGAVDYESERRWPGPLPARCSVAYAAEGPVRPAAAGTLEHFLAERYLLYAVRQGKMLRGRVHHAPYPLQAARAELREETLLAAAGVRREGDPPLRHYARAVDVEIFAPERLC